MSSYSISGNLVDIPAQKIYPAEVFVEHDKIAAIRKLDPALLPAAAGYILPGFIDSHVHIESSMLIPSEFAKLAVVHGTVGTVSDPHEIANVCGIAGVEFMIENGKTVPFKFNFGAPSCVPATTFETAGAAIDAAETEKLLQRNEIKYLSEMMNFPGVLQEDKEVMRKISAAHKLQKPVDGHAPGLRGEAAKAYIAAGITTDHECFTKEEALDKLQNGMKIIIREGSAAKNFDALIGLLHDYPNQMMFCSDDKHPDSLVEGHIDRLCARAVEKGINVFKVLQAACVNPVLHYKLDIGLLQEGDPADFIIIKDLKTFAVWQTYITGRLVAANGKSRIESQQISPLNHFDCRPLESDDLYVPHPGKKEIEVIEALDGQLITNKYLQTTVELATGDTGEISGNPGIDILKIVVVNRYAPAKAAISFIKNFGLKQGALASSVAHDSHNIVAVGVDDESICKAINMIIAHKGGISCVKDNLEMIIPLPVAGLMSQEDGYKVAAQYSLIDKAAKEAGCTLASPFMTLSFMALLVIPHLKLSDLGLFDGDKFAFIV